MRGNLFSTAALLGLLAWGDAGARGAPLDRGGSVVLLTEGIVGGFVPAHVRYQAVIRPLKDAYEVVVMSQPERGSPRAFRSGTLTPEQLQGVVEDLARQGLWELPVEVPTGCQDVYRADTSLALLSGRRFWRNGGPAGCVHGTSKVQPTAKQIETFRALVARVKQLAEKQATARSDQGTFQAALLAAEKQMPRGGTKGQAPVDR